MYKLFDKGDSSSFSIVSMPYLDSNIPSKIFYSEFRVEILRSARTIIDATIFQRNPKFLINRIMKHGDKTNILSTTLNEVFGCHLTSTITLPLNLSNQ